MQETSTPRNAGASKAGAGLPVLSLIVAAYVLWILSLPCFPTADGPVHMYYVHVLNALLFSKGSVYTPFFRIRHILPPYSLYYYALLFGSKLAPILLVDRVIICCYVVSFTFGFRYLAKAIGPAADLTTLLATTLLLNWPLGMGFVNFCLSLSFSFWATGLWIRIQGRNNVRGRVLFLAVVTATMLTHPVPLLLLLTVTGALLIASVVQASLATGAFYVSPSARVDLLTWVLASLNLLYVKLYASSNPFRQTEDQQVVSYWGEMVQRIGIYSHEHGLSFLLGRTLDLTLYRTSLMLVLLVSLAAAVWQRLQNRSAKVWTQGDTFLVLGVLLLVLLPFIPSQLNGLYYFADRLVICVWLAFLLAASGWRAEGNRATEELPSKTRRSVPLNSWQPLGAKQIPFAVAAVFAVLSSALLLTVADGILRPIAAQIAALEHQDIRPEHQVGFILNDPGERTGTKANLSWDPYYWATIHLFRRNNLILANAPWMDESILPVAARPALPEVGIPSLREPFPTKLQGDLLRSPGDLRAALAADSLFVVNGIGRPPLRGQDPLLALPPGEIGRWSCQSVGWYRICRRP